ncbi:hypothetical protein HJC23_011351, partial [Cyclotella cryptica]
MNMSEHNNENPGILSPTPIRKKRYVKAALIDHTYNDFSTYQFTDSGSFSQRIGSNVASFPQKLHYILSRPEYHHIISWMSHGRAWKILDKKLLVSVVCKEQFKHEKFESFNRQVNGWGFKRLLRSGPDYKCYYNQYFLRGLPHLTRHMHRLDKPGKRLPNKLEEPDLYELSLRFPLPEINARMVAPNDKHSSRLPESKCLTASRDPHPPITVQSDCNDSSPKVNAVCATFSHTCSPTLVSIANSESKISQWQPESQESEGGELSPFLITHTHYRDVSRSLGNHLPFSCNTFEFSRVSIDNNGSQENYKTERYYENRFGDQGQLNVVQQEYCMLPSRRKFDQPNPNDNTACHTFGQDNEMKSHAASNTQETDSYHLTKWQNRHSLSHHYRKGEQFIYDSQNCIDTPEDASKSQYYESNKHHTWSSRELDHNAQWSYPARTRSWYQHPLAHYYEAHRPAQERCLRNTRNSIGSPHDPFKNYLDESNGHGLGRLAAVAVQESYPHSDSSCRHQLESRSVVHNSSAEHQSYESSEPHGHILHGQDTHYCPCSGSNFPSQVEGVCGENQILPQLGNQHSQWSTKHHAFEDNGETMNRSTDSCNSLSSCIFNDSFFEFEEPAFMF